MDICRNKRTGEYYIVIEENNDKLLLVTPHGEMKNKFRRDAFEDPIYYDEGIMNLSDFLSEEQCLTYRIDLWSDILPHVAEYEAGSDDLKKKAADMASSMEDLSIRKLEGLRDMIKEEISKIRLSNLRLSSLRQRRY